MSENTGFQFTDDAVPRAYEEVLVHRMFEPWAVLLLDACDLRPDAVVLDVATGPGTVARLAARRIGRGGRVVATDISRPMLDAAALGEMRRALKPGGQLAIAAWSHIEDNAFYRRSTRHCARARSSGPAVGAIQLARCSSPQEYDRGCGLSPDPGSEQSLTTDFRERDRSGR